MINSNSLLSKNYTVEMHHKSNVSQDLSSILILFSILHKNLFGHAIDWKEHVINAKRIIVPFNLTKLNTILTLYFSKLSHINWKSFVVTEVYYSLREFVFK